MYTSDQYGAVLKTAHIGPEMIHLKPLSESVSLVVGSRSR